MTSPHLDATWLRQKYEAEGLSTYEIGTLVGRDPKSVYNKLRDFGIPTRPRGQNLKGDDNYWSQPDRPNPMQGRQHTAAAKAKLSAAAKGARPHLRGVRNGMFGQTGPASARYLGGISPERQRVYASSDWKFLERAVYERDAAACRRCHGIGSGLNIHHIVPWSESVELRLAINNLVAMCVECHRWVHGVANAGEEWLAHGIASLSSSPRT